jgi:hypothetical protein
VNLDGRLAALEERVAALELERPGRSPMPILVSQRGVCGVDPDSNSITCPHASLYRRRKGCLGHGCQQASSEYYERYRTQPVAPRRRKK